MRFSTFKNIKWKEGEVFIFRFLTLISSMIMLIAYFLIKNQYSEEAVDWALRIRLPLAGLFFLLFILSFQKTFKKRYLSQTIIFLYYLITARVLLTASGADFRREALVAVIIAIQVIAVLIRDKVHLGFYLIIVSLAFSALVFHSIGLEGREKNAIIFLLGILVIVNFMINFFRIKASEQKDRYLHEMEKSKEKLEEITNKLMGTNAKLARRNQELDKFSYLVSHDLKAPLRAINNLSTWIEEDLQGKMDEDTADNMKIMRGRVVRLENLIDGLLDYHSFGKELAEPVEVNTKMLVEHLRDNLKNGAAFDFEISEQLPKIMARYKHIYEIFKRLIENSILHHPNEKGQIAIGHEYRFNFHYFYVKDDGKGIAEKYHEKVFTIFQTLQARDRFETIGVGLPIVKKIVELEGGNIWIDIAHKKGAKIWFTLPVEPLQE